MAPQCQRTPTPTARVRTSQSRCGVRARTLGGHASLAGRDDRVMLDLVEVVSLDIAPAIALHPRSLPSPAQPPRLCEGTVARVHLLRRLTGSRARPVVLMVGPAGYGKTTLAAEWTSREERPSTWFAFSEPGATASALRAVADARCGPTQLIVVDDAQQADAETLHELLERATRLPYGSTLAVLSRTAPGEPTGRLRAHRLMLEIAAPDLAMTHLEAALLFEAAGVSLSAAQVG